MNPYSELGSLLSTAFRISILKITVLFPIALEIDILFGEESTSPSAAKILHPP